MLKVVALMLSVEWPFMHALDTHAGELTARLGSVQERDPKSPLPHHWADSSCTPSRTASMIDRSSDRAGSWIIWTTDPGHWMDRQEQITLDAFKLV